MSKLRVPFGGAVREDRGSDAESRAVALPALVAALLAGLLGLGALFVGAPSARAAADEDGFTFQDSRIVESSGLATSRAHPGVYWTHNDSGYDPTRIYAVDSRNGETVATVTLEGVEGRDLEGISVGPDGDVYVGDIGDNLGGTWSEVWIYRFPEPKKLQDVTLTPTIHTVRYADGPRDAEALMVHPKTGRVYLSSKSDEGEGALYRGPAELVSSAAGVNTFERVVDISMWVTDGAFSPDGSRLALRSYFNGSVYVWEDGKPVRPSNVKVPLQQQGESVAFTRDGRTLMFGSEGENSPVEPVKLTGDQLPDSVPDEEKESGPGDGAGGTDEDKQRNLGRMGLVFLVAVAVVWALRRLLRRRHRS